MTNYWNELAVGILVLVWISSSVAHAESADDPQYVAEPCCQLCPDAQQGNADVPGGIQEGRDGWLFTSSSRAPTPVDSEYRRLLSLFATQLAERGSSVMLVMPPPRSVMYAVKQRENGNTDSLQKYLHTLNEFRQAGIQVPAYEQLLLQADEQTTESFFFKRDLHWTSVGARKTADFVADEIRKLPLFHQLPEQRFVTQTQGWLKISGELNNQSGAACGGQRYPLEYTPLFVTRAVSENTDKPNHILLVGSSRSVDSRFNFNGFLQQALARRIENHTDATGNSTQSWLRMLASDRFRYQPPALVLWELPYESRELSTSLLRQMVALVGNGCETRPVLLHEVKTISGSQTEDLIFADKLLETAPEQLVFDLTFNNPKIEQLLLTVWFSDGGKSDFQIRKNTAAMTDGRFSFVLGNIPSGQQRKFVSMDLTLPDSQIRNLKVSTNVCRLQNKLLQSAGRSS